MIYLDYAAATPVNKQVFAAAAPFYSEQFYNPSARYQPAKQVKTALQEARSTIAGWLECRSQEVLFTAGGTEANNLAIKGVMEQYPGKRCVISAVEHDSVRVPAQRYRATSIAVTEDGIVTTAALEQAIDEETVLVSVMYANNEIGSIQPLRKVAAMLQNIRRQRIENGNELPLYFHTDACQAPNYLDLHVNNLGVDMMTLNGGKIYGFKQSGCLYVHRRTALTPIIGGGGQEGGLRSGTENVAQAVGLAAAIDRSQRRQADESTRIKALQSLFIDQLEKSFKDCFINGSRKHRLPNNVHVTFPGQHNEMVLLKLEQHDIFAAAGSACSADDHEKPSYALEAIGRTAADAQASIRFSLGEQTTKKDIIKTLDALKQSLQPKQ